MNFQVNENKFSQLFQKLKFISVENLNNYISTVYLIEIFIYLGFSRKRFNKIKWHRYTLLFSE